MPESSFHLKWGYPLPSRRADGASPSWCYGWAISRRTIVSPTALTPRGRVALPFPDAATAEGWRPSAKRVSRTRTTRIWGRKRCRSAPFERETSREGSGYPHSPQWTPGTWHIALMAGRQLPADGSGQTEANGLSEPTYRGPLKAAARLAERPVIWPCGAHADAPTLCQPMVTFRSKRRTPLGSRRCGPAVRAGDGDVIRYRRDRPGRCIEGDDPAPASERLSGWWTAALPVAPLPGLRSRVCEAERRGRALRNGLGAARHSGS